MADLRLQKVETYIRNHHHDVSLSVAKLAEYAGLSQTQLREIAFREKRTHPSAMLESYRLALASKLLKDPSLRVQEISLRVGYWNTKTFREAFRKRFGKCPNEYRANF